MKLHINTVIIVLVLLGLGFTMGMITSGILMDKKVRNLVETRLPGNFERHILTALELSQEQMAEIKPILASHATSNKESFKALHQQRMASLDSLRKEVYPILDESQKATFDKVLKEMNRMGQRPPDHRKKRHPGKKKPREESNQ